MYDGRLSAHLTVKDWMEQYNGNWQEEWTNRFPNLVNIQTVRLDMQTKDGVKWRKRDGSLCNFTVNQAYRELIREEDDVDWWKINDAESYSHLFFECEYSKTFWSKLVDKVGMACNNYKLNEIVAGLSKKTNGNSIDSIIRRICFAASVYLVWQERNNRIFRDEKRN
ncbi:hypothetical protein Tco_0197317, partial [Tanacetum coccineum]